MTVRTCTFIGFVVLICAISGHSSWAQNRLENVSPGILHGVRAGLLAHDLNVWASSTTEDGIDVNLELIFKYPNLWLGSGRILPNVGMSINTRGDTSKAYGGVLWEFSLFGDRFFTNTGLGLAVHNGELDSGDSRKQLGSRVLFRIPFEFGFTIHGPHRISILFDHMSNAYMADPNPGMDTLGVRYGYRF